MQEAMKATLVRPHIVRAMVMMALSGLCFSANSQERGGSFLLEEVIVSATKRVDTIDSTSAAISAVRSDDLGPGGIQDIRDLSTAVPNLSVGDQFGVNRTFIRGIGMTSIDLGADGAVAFLQDGTMIARPSAQLGGFFDLEQVEVLRGPQGTIYGRGATAGVVNMITSKPTEELDGYVRLTGGNYSAYTAEGAISGPIAGEGVMGRLAAKFDKRDGYGKNLFTGSEIDDRDAFAIRGSVRFKASDTLELSLIGDYLEEDDNNYAFHYFGPTVVPESALAHKLLGGQTIFDYYGSHGGNPGRNIYSNEDPINEREGAGITALADWQINDAWLLKSVSAWRDFERFTRNDLDVSDVWMYGQNNYIEDSETWSQEFTLSGSVGNLEILAGAMYFNEKLHGEVKIPTVNIAVLLGAGLDPPLPADFFDDGFFWQNGDVETDAYGVFLQGTYPLTEQLSLTAGARYNYEKKVGTGSFIFDAAGINIPTDKSASWDAVTPKLLLEYTTGSGSLLYGQVTRGFKSGVINIGSQNDVIDPEYVWSYEVGYKTQFASGRTSMRTAAFYYDYTDLQVGFVNSESIVETINAASARNIGLEMELVSRLAQNLTGTVSATWLDAEYEDFVNGDYRQGFAPVDLSGNRLQNAPEYSVRMALDYRQPVAAKGAVVARMDASWQDDVFFTEFNSPDAMQKSYGLVNASLGYEGDDGRWSIVAWGRNLSDEYVISNNIVAAPLFGLVRLGSLLPPRTYGVTFSYNFF